MQTRTSLSAWQRLLALAKSMKSRHLRDFWHDPARAEKLSCRAGPVFLDISKQRVDDEAVASLLELAEACGLWQSIADMMQGAAINNTEQRAALHTALRMEPDANVQVDGHNVIPDVHASLDRMEYVVNRVHSQQWRGYSGRAISDVVNIGVGGSDLGPSMVSEALTEFTAEPARGLRFHYVSSIDGTQIADLLQSLNPKTTLFIISSKSFTTVDTLSNARTAWEWMLREKNDAQMLLQHHFIGVSAQPERMTQWGILPENQICLWDWVGGRFSLWSAIGLPVALQIGMKGFRELLAGARFMDRHFAQTPFADNLPVLLGMIGVWNATFLDIRGHAVMPYDGRLGYFPAYLTQLEMESNGKSVTRDGYPVDYTTCPILWGEVGPNAQHAFYQLLHQGTQAISSDFIAPVRRYHDRVPNRALVEQHQLSLANCLAQSRVLMLGDAAIQGGNDAPDYRRYRGNQPSTTILLDELNPYALGALIALYEHKVFVMSVIWDINPFDQWGVELGKVMATGMLSALQTGVTPDMDASSALLLQQIIEQGENLS
ncbi:MAG TPA: glucose-6-phosphate isomerase [Moraxellaceae bacterium]|nr:glucose-6-phosphate isomerase [Moraxellaceae bacterium]